jgi:hypothetical protein
MEEHEPQVRVVKAMRPASSLPMRMMAPDGDEFLVKLAGAGAGPAALAVEMVAANLADLVGVPVPARRVVTLGAEVPSPDRDPEVLELLAASAGQNLAFAWLPDAERYDPARHAGLIASLAATIVAFDVFILNVDRRADNPNLVVSRGRPWAIDHEASLIIRGVTEDADGAAAARIVAGHALQPGAAALATARVRLRFQLSAGYIGTALRRVPDDWLVALPGGRAGVRARLIDRLLRF